MNACAGVLLTAPWARLFHIKNNEYFGSSKKETGGRSLHGMAGANLNWISIRFGASVGVDDSMWPAKWNIRAMVGVIASHGKWIEWKTRTFKPFISHWIGKHFVMMMIHTRWYRYVAAIVFKFIYVYNMLVGSLRFACSSILKMFIGTFGCGQENGAIALRCGRCCRKVIVINVRAFCAT